MAIAEFPLQNLPFGVFSPPRRTAPMRAPRGGVAIGDMIFDLRAALDAGLFSGEAERAAEAASGRHAEPADGAGRGSAPRIAAAGLRAACRRRTRTCQSSSRSPTELLHRAADCWLHLPAAIGNFTDFFAGIHHAANGGRRRDPNNPLSANYKYVPVAYHSRASSVRESGVPVRRPNGQRKPPDEDAPSYGPCRNLDYELELAVWIGPGNRAGRADPDRRGRRAYLRPRAGQRLVGARHPVLGDAAARTVPRQKFRQHGLAVDRHGRGAGAVPRRAAAAARRRPAPAALSVGRQGPAERAPSTSRSKRCC